VKIVVDRIQRAGVDAHLADHAGAEPAAERLGHGAAAAEADQIHARRIDGDAGHAVIGDDGLHEAAFMAAAGIGPVFEAAAGRTEVTEGGGAIRLRLQRQ
jgi:hypothetical protein